MLGKKKEAAYGDIDTFISHHMEIKGEIHTKGSLRLDGRVEGQIKAEGDVVLGEKGWVKGEIKAKNIIIAGNIEGNVHAENRLEIAPSGQVHGDVACDILVIEEGGILNGLARMKKMEKKEERGKEKK
ncbi:protein CcmA, bactofilin family [Thermosyntropha lipolytica DSM 11003]|uniref:Protein CcmA, bactofilin family n=1 Tax=Thermosyntropha lipolytica DSM 11003 TaxID=1123382 RepID=A0A1M5QV96_9FIRM|nr:polymer-forming cytoskeletal protein [Thermosyntropha lipolytica]SHH18022.1 protein CcmA, bactofilin family [Thermosyntropha lipolytica DSM 11003]